MNSLAAVGRTTGLWLVRWLLRWLAGLLGGPVLLAALAAATLVAVVAGLFAPGTRESALDGARQAVAAAVPVRSYNGAERAHMPQAGLVAAMALEAQAEGRDVSMAEVARALAPAFRYRDFTLVSERTVLLPDGTWQAGRTERTVLALTHAETYQETVRYRYRVRRVEQPGGYSEELEVAGVERQPAPGRLAELLSGVLGRVVSPEEAAWLGELGADLEAGAPGPRRWLARP